MKTADYRMMLARRMSEKQLQDRVVTLAHRMGWLTYHTFDSRRSDPGFPDLVLVHPRQRRVLFRELKAEAGTVRPDQKTWIATLGVAGADASIWRPRDWFAGTIETELRSKQC